MAIRKVFTTESGKEIFAYILENGNLYIEIKDQEQTSFIALPDNDAREFIMELYRMKGSLTGKIVID